MRVATATRPSTVIGVRPDAQTPRASAAPCPAGLEAGSRPRSRAPAVHVMIPKYLIAAEARVLCARRRCITQLVAQTPIKAPAPQDLGLLGSRGSEYGGRVDPHARLREGLAGIDADRGSVLRGGCRRTGPRCSPAGPMGCALPGLWCGPWPPTRSFTAADPVTPGRQPYRSSDIRPPRQMGLVDIRTILYQYQAISVSLSHTP